MPNDKTPLVTIPRRKAILFSLVPAALLLILAVLVEGTLRIFGDSSAEHLVASYTYDGQEWLRVNRSYLEKYFPANSPLIPELKPTIVHARKDSSEFRLLCLGESSMFGTPYQNGATIPSILQKQLRTLFPDREITVINLGASAINTNVIADFLPQTMELRPDAVVIYTGHNEFYGPDAIGAPWLERTFPFLIGMKYSLRDFRIVHAVQRWLRSLWLSRNANAEQNMMRQVSEGVHVRSGSEEERWIVRRFEHNLQQILAFYHDRRVPVIVSDVASNLLFPPFVQDSSDDFRKGMDLVGHGDTAQGRALLIRARDEDLLKFRAPSAINATIDSVCRRTGTPHCSTVALFDSLSPGRIPGYNLFWEHLHPRAVGYYHIADLFLRNLLQLGLPGSANPESLYARRLPFDVHKLGIGWLDQAIGDIAVQGLTGRWPFEHFSTHTAVFEESDTALQRIALDVYRNRLTWNEGNLHAAEWFEAHHKPDDAATSYEAILDEYPRAYAVRYLLANLLRSEGLNSEAEDQYRRLLHTNPDYPFAHVELGLMLINEGAFAEAGQHLTAALALADHGVAVPATLRASAYYGLSAVEANNGHLSEALRLVDESLRFSPSYVAASQLRQRILLATRR